MLHTHFRRNILRNSGTSLVNGGFRGFWNPLHQKIRFFFTCMRRKKCSGFFPQWVISILGLSAKKTVSLSELTLLATGYFSPGCHGGWADSAHHFGKPGRASFKILTSFEKNTLNITWKKAQNPKDEVSSLKIDEMAKDGKIMAKTRNR